MSIPHAHYSHQLSYNHTLSQLIYEGGSTVCIWDTEHSKYLLDHMSIGYNSKVYASSNGPFFIQNGSEVTLWKESPTGYTLHQRFISNTHSTTLCISPNRESVLTCGGSVAQLWHTTDSNTSLPTIPTQPSQRDTRSSLLGPSPDEGLAAVIQGDGKVATVLDLRSGVPGLIIDTGMDVYGLGTAGGTIVVVGYEKIVTWSLLARGCILKPRVNMGDSVKITAFDQPEAHCMECLPALVSPDLHHMVLTSQNDTVIASEVDLYDVLTGQHLGHWNGREFRMCSFTPDGDEFWQVNYDGDMGNQWKILKDGKSNTIKPEHLGSAKPPKDALPWQCPPGYKVTDDGWILHSSRKRLLWLPPHWWPSWWDRVWQGQFLVLLNDKLPELLILNLE